MKLIKLSQVELHVINTAKLPGLLETGKSPALLLAPSLPCGAELVNATLQIRKKGK